jgi:hypothetical protein
MISVQLTEITRKTHNVIFTIYMLLVSEISELPFQYLGLPGNEAFQTFWPVCALNMLQKL